LAGPGGVILVGVDLPKVRGVLELAYDDPAGVTAAFNLNLLHRVQHELGAAVDPDHFWHQAVWQPEPSRIEMRLVAKRPTRIEVAGRTFIFDRDDWIVTEHCYKHSVPAFTALSRRAGLEPNRVFFDRRARVSLHWLDVPRPL
jgi:uncharacterized SAM-dependent methyltransferase